MQKAVMILGDGAQGGRWGGSEAWWGVCVSVCVFSVNRLCFLNSEVNSL